MQTLLLEMLGPVLAESYLTMIGDQSLFIEKTAHEVIWGYQDPMLEMLVLLGLTNDPLMKIDVGRIMLNFIAIILIVHNIF